MKSQLSQLVLAIDPGGTKCDALLARADGTLVNQCRLRDWKTGGRDPRIVRRAIIKVLARREPAPVRVVGISKRATQKLLPQSWRKMAKTLSGSEPQAALAAAGYSYGMVVIAGTGARVAMRARTGRETSVDALGPVLGDGGSGYYIGREALRAVSREMQLGCPSTRLRRRILQACGCRDLGDLILFSLEPRDRSRIASLAIIVDEEARGGDRLARQLLHDGATMLMSAVRDLVVRQRNAGDKFPVVGAGSVAVRSDIYWREVCRQMRVILPRCELVRLDLPPVAGLAALGLGEPIATAKLFATLTQKRKKL